jgi:alpha-1,2-mannosyltransferase
MRDNDVVRGGPVEHSSRLARPATRVGLVVLLVAAAVGFDAAFAQRHGFFDLNVYWGAINYWVGGHGELYDFVRPRSTYGFTYPPFAAIAMLPMALVAWPVAIIVASLATAAATIFVTWLILRQNPRWAKPAFPVAVAVALLIAFEPLRETFLFGQVNMLLVALVAGDLLLGVSKGRKWGGVGIGLATAIKLTPGIFILYLLVTRRFRAAFTAMGAAAGATLVAAAVAPDAAREFFTSAIWDTDRIGALWFASNQSLQGAVARLDHAHPSKILWLVLVVATLAIWFIRVRRAARAGDEAAGFAITAIVGCLISPVTWIHHLVWLVPALLLLVVAGSRRRDWRPIALAVTLYAILCSRLVWLYDADFGPGWSTSGVLGFLGSNGYVWISVILLLTVPIQRPQPAVLPVDGVADLGQTNIAASRRPVGPRPVRV